MPALDTNIRDAEVTKVEKNGWGVLVTVVYFDKSARYDNALTRCFQFMMSEHEQPSVGQKLKITVGTA